MTDTTTKRTYKPRGPWSEERRAKVLATKAATAAANLKKFGTKMAPEVLAKHHKTLEATVEARKAKAEDRRNNSKAQDYVFVLQFLILAILRAEQNREVFDSFVAGQPEMDIAWDYNNQNILFSFSTNGLRPQYGALAEGIFRKLFVCVQPGGYSRSKNQGYKSVWMLNKQALDIWLIQTSNKKITVSQVMKFLSTIEPLRRAATEYDVVKVDEHYEVQGKNKQIMTPLQRMVALEGRAEVKKVVEAKNTELMSDWVQNKKNKKAVA